MLTAHARVETVRAARYLDQLCRHAGRMAHTGFLPRLHGKGGHVAPEVEDVDRTETEATLRLSAGRVVVRAGEGELILQAEADDEGRLGQIQELVGRRLATLGSRERLTVEWIRGDDAPGGAAPQL